MQENLTMSECVCDLILWFVLFWYFVLGIMVFKNGDRYEGEFKDGKKHGQGKEQ